MEKSNKISTKVIYICIILLLIGSSIVMASIPTTRVNPTENQYFELRAVNVENVEGQNKQVIMELWGHDIEFKGLDVRFAYDNTKLQPSNIETNEITEKASEYFRFENEFQNSFKNSLDMFAFSDENIIQSIISFNPPVEESEHIIEKEGIGKVVTTKGGVLLGKISFQMTADVFDISCFHLVEDEESSPNTGIKINLDGKTYFDNQSTFRFVDDIASKDANLTNIILSNNQDNLTDKQYSLSPVFEKDITNYKVEILENINKLNIKAIQSDKKATMKIKVPKRDVNGNLEYEPSGTDIIYEEKEIINDTPLEIALNKLGEPNTLISIIVTAEDGKTTNEYKVSIHRPYGTIKGSIHTINSVNKHIADIKLYETRQKIDWENLYGHDELDLIPIIVAEKSNETGMYEIKVTPGQYDLIIDKIAYLDHIITEITINENDVIDLGNIDLIPGDINKDGLVDTEDLTFVNIYYDVMQEDAGYELKYDINEDGIIEAEDMTYINIYYDKTRTINIKK